MFCDWYAEMIYPAAGPGLASLRTGHQIMIGINKSILRLDFIKV